MVINSATSAPDFQKAKAHGARHAHHADNASQTGTVSPADADNEAITSENVAAATPLANADEARQSLDLAQRAMAQQPSQALLAHSTEIPQSVLQLLQP